MSHDNQSAAESREAARRIAQREALSIDPFGPLQRGRAELINCVREPFKEFERMFPKEAPMPDPKITVSIPIVIGGWTGQRDAYEKNDIDVTVTLTEKGELLLTEKVGVQRTFSIPWDTLQAAVRLVSKPPPPGPVYRNSGVAPIEGGQQG